MYNYEKWMIPSLVLFSIALKVGSLVALYSLCIQPTHILTMLNRDQEMCKKLS